MIGGPCLLALEQMFGIVSLSLQEDMRERQTVKGRETRKIPQQKLESCETE